MNNQNMNNFMNGMMNNQAFFNGGDQQDSPLFDDKKFQDSLNTGPRGGTSIQNLKGGGNNQSFQYNPDEFSQPSQQQQLQHPPQLQQQIRQPSQPFQQPQQFQQQQQQQPQQFQQQQPQQFQPQQPQQFQQQPFHQSQQYQQQISRKFNDNASHMSQNSQNSQYSDCSNISKNSNKSSPIKKLGNIINNKLKDKNDSIINSINSISSHDSMTINSDTDENKEVNNKINKKSSNEIYIDMAKDAILIIVIYLILSQDFLKRAIGVYLPQIESDNVVGNAIYGAIHAIIFIAFKIIFNSIFM